MYYNTISRVRKVEPKEHLDPDFGGIHPDPVDAYVISVTPRGADDAKSRYQFITLLPETETNEESFELLDEVMTEFLDEGDRYTVRECTDKHVEEYIAEGSKGPIISFDPVSLEADQISFLWLTPPKFLMQ